MEFRHLRFGGRRRGISIAIAVALLGPCGVAAQIPTTSNVGNGVIGELAVDAHQDPPVQPAGSSTAATDLNAVVVTANKRSERLQDVPMAVSALGGSQLERESALSFADYAARVPGLNLISSGAGQTQLVLRGITSGSGQQSASVGTYVDDVPYGSSTIYSIGGVLTPDIDPADLQRIEVLRGPQGTLYGSNTLGGLVKFVTTPPDTTRASARIRVDASSVAGGDTGFGTHAMFNIPLAEDRLGLRVNAYHRTDPGYIDNVASGRADVNGATVSGTRAQLLWTPTDKLSLRLSALAQNLDSDGLANGGVDVDPATLRPIYGDLRHDHPPGTGMFKVKYRLYAASLDADLGWARLVSTSSYSTLGKNSNTDITQVEGPQLNPYLGIPNGGYSLLNPIALEKVTQELRLQSPEQQTWEWRTGLFYTHEHSSNRQSVPAFDATTGVPIALPQLGYINVGPASFTEWAGYGDLTWHATSRLSVLVGARYSSDRTAYTQSGDGLLAGGVPARFTIRGSDHPFTYLVNPSYKFSDDMMAYARIASGFHPGGPNVGVPPGLGAPLTFNPDKLVSYELGLKSSLLDKRMSIDVAAFYIDWSQIQLSVSTGGFAFLGNGGKARSRGVEAEWQYRPVHGLLLSANASWTDATLTADTPPGLYGYKGDRLPYVPKWNANLGIDYDFPLAGGWSAFVGGSYRFIGERQSDFNAEPGPRLQIPRYELLDLRAGINYDNWTFKAYIKNLTNRRGIASIGAESIDPNASPFAAAYVTPRTVGLSASVDF